MHRTDFHEVASDSLPDDAGRICPLIGNDEIKLCVDARGVMHDFAHRWGSHPPARITWSGRRHDRRNDRYNSNLFEWGYLDLVLEGESDLPAVTAWRQRLHPRDGYVETEIQRGLVRERTLSFVHLERNLVVFHRTYENLSADRVWRMQAVHTLCQVGVDELPFRVRWTPGEPTATGIAADTEADGMWLYRGRLALFADTAVTASAVGNTLRLELELPATAAIGDGAPSSTTSRHAVTVCLSLCDDLGDHPQILDIPHAGWMSEGVKQVHADNTARLKDWRPADYRGATAAAMADLEAHGFAGIFRTHCTAWRTWFAQLHLELPVAETQLRMALDTQLYTMRCCYTAWSMPANPFNTSWGAPYFWDERFPTEALMRLGFSDMPTRTLEWRRAILPFSTMMSGGRGARYVPAAVESGSQIADQNGTQYYEFFTIGVIVNYVYEYCRYHDDDATWHRYFPILRECAEFFRRYLLIELPGNNIMLTWLIDVDETHYPVQDGPFAVAGAARSLQTAIATAERLGIDDPALPEWRRIGAMTLHLARHLGAGATARDPANTCANDPASTYVDYELGDYPPPAIDVDPAIEAWRDTYRQRFAPKSQMTAGSTNISGEAQHLAFWSWGPLQAAHAAAGLGQSEKAMHQLRHALTTLMDFAALNESARVDLADVHHPWFNTAAGAYGRALAHMLVYPKDAEIRLLPGIPAGWNDFAFTLPVHRGGSISVVVRDHELVTVTVTESRPQVSPRRIELPRRYLPSSPRWSPGVSIVAETSETWVVALPADWLTGDIFAPK